ncbi:MAG: ParB N-terminal domain-containing protein [Oscillospiraceae bacterium]|nr:ParB N-terminal domain-containing protein [Oscillospiraceae bacterium]
MFFKFYDDEIETGEIKFRESKEEDQENIDSLLELIETEEAFTPCEEESIRVEDLLSHSNINEFPYEDPNDRDIFDASSAKKIRHADKPKDLNLSYKHKYNNKVRFFRLSELVDIDYSVNFFPLPDEEEFSDLVESIRNFGILTPLLVQKDKDSNKYIVISGRSRRAALYTLFNQTSDEVYLYAPCLELDETIDFSTIQGIILSTNLAYRKIPKDIQIKAILLLDEWLLKSKRYNREMNVTDEIANRAGISKTTANTIRGFKNLSPLALDLLYKNHISRGAARLLSMIADHKKQDAIITKLGNEINDLNKIRDMIDEPEDEPKKEVYHEDTKPSLPAIPENTKIEIFVHKDEVEDVLKSLISLKGKAVIKFNISKNGEIDKYFRVNLNENHINQYIKNGFVTKGTVDLIRSVDHKELVKYS